ncbi:MAG: MFS transporter [Proteobacteria bacterium]|nr:MFS transporter [Pseudomonadota bacterium]
MDRNLWLYPRYAAARNLLFWLPVFFLYFQQALDIGEVLWLEAIYYTAFVILEVPSGYLSDRLGRRLTLIAGAALSSVGALVFATSHGFAPWALGQVLFAAGFAFDSGTDTSLLYDSLAAEGREDEYRQRESQAASASLWAVAAASLIGGLIGAIDLRLAYLATAVAVGTAAILAAAFVEPPRVRAQTPLLQIRAVRTALQDGVLRWTMLVALLGTILNHVPYEFLQPWLDTLVADRAQTPVWSGALSFLIVGISAVAAGQADALATRWGARNVVLGALGLQTLVIGAMGWTAAWWLVPVLLLRGLPGAVLRPVLGSLQHPRLSASIRATTLSIQSLVGRLSFGLCLVIAGAWAHDGMFPLLRGFAVFGAVALFALWAGRPGMQSAGETR